MTLQGWLGGILNFTGFWLYSNWFLLFCDDAPYVHHPTFRHIYRSRSFPINHPSICTFPTVLTFWVLWLALRVIIKGELLVLFYAFWSYFHSVWYPDLILIGFIIHLGFLFSFGWNDDFSKFDELYLWNVLLSPWTSLALYVYAVVTFRRLTGFCGKPMLVHVNLKYHFRRALLSYPGCSCTWDTVSICVLVKNFLSLLLRGILFKD